MASSASAQIEQYWYRAPFGTSVNSSNMPLADYSMPGAATNGNSFFAIKGAPKTNGNDPRSSHLWQRTGGPGSGGSWKDWGDRYPSPETFSLRVPLATYAGVNVRAKTNLPKNWWYDTMTNAPGMFTCFSEVGFQGPSSRIPGTTKTIAPVINYSGWSYTIDYAVKDYSNLFLPAVEFQNTPIGVDIYDMCAADKYTAYAVDQYYQLWRIENPSGLWNLNNNSYSLLGQGFASVSDQPGDRDCYATDWNGELYAVSKTWGLTNLGRPAGKHIWSSVTVFDGGKHYVIAACDTGVGLGNGKEQLYTKAYDWGLNTWLSWKALAPLPVYLDKASNSLVKPYVIGSPTLDETGKKIVVVDQRGTYFRGGWNWNETTWLWENHGRP
ncbi:MAG: hypothetical protein JST30_12895 [Armatimonadetes bacterium]|nr:hypothetical protein [Armatimonadota bacterium]